MQFRWRYDKFILCICCNKPWLSVRWQNPENVGSSPAGTIWVIGSGRKGVQPKLLPCTDESPIYPGRHVGAVEQGSQQR